ncbi:MAG: hypothetical protein OWU84_10305 [Firmicutes bacterium]|nr:hypothetical protein [Bacillota bacterium]
MSLMTSETIAFCQVCDEPISAEDVARTYQARLCRDCHQHWLTSRQEWQDAADSREKRRLFWA